MAITLVGSSAPAKVIGGGVTLPWPAGHQAGDVAIIYIAMRSSGSTTPALPAGTTTIIAQAAGAAGTTTGYLSGLRVCYKIATSSAEASLSIASGTTYTIAAMSVFRGVDNTSPVYASAGGRVDASTVDLQFAVAPPVVGLTGTSTAIAIAAWGRSVAATGVDFGTLEVNNGGTGSDAQGSLYSTIGSVTSASTDLPTFAGTYLTGSTNKIATAHGWVVLREDAIAAGSSTGTFAFSGTAALGGTAAAQHSGTFAFSGTATGQVESGSSSSGSFAFSGSAALSGTGALAASIASIVSGSAVIGGTADAQHSGAFAFSGTATGAVGTFVSATLTSAFSGTAALGGMGALASSAGFAFGGSAAVSATAQISSTGAFAFGGTATALQIAALAHSGGFSLTGTAAIKSIPNPIYAETWKNKWLAVYVARQALLDKIANVAKTTLDSHASSITSLTASVAGKASVTAVETLEARVTATEAVYGVNLLRNPGLAIDDKGWLPLGLSWNQSGDPTWSYGRDDLGSSYQVTGTHNFGMHNTGTPTASQNYVAGFELVPVEAGYSYLFSAWLAAANVSACDLRLYYYDAAFAYIAEHNTNPVGGTYTGGTNIANWQRQYSLSTPPAGAKWMRIGLRVYTSGAATPRAHIMQPMLERAAPGQTLPSTYNTGPVTAWAKWDVTFNVDGYISGITLASDGRSTGFNVAADVFGVRAPSGSDALTWEGGVLTALKGANSLKLGPGFGYSGTGTKRLILWYGEDGSTDTRTMANAKIAIATSGAPKLGGVQTNMGSGWATGGAVSTYGATAGTPATATISVASGTFYIDGDSVAYGASSVGVSGTNGTTVTYYLYYIDAERSGGTLTLYASTDIQVAYTNAGHVMVGKIAVAYPLTGSSSGSGGSAWCVSTDAWVYLRTADGACAWAQAGDVRAGDYMLLRCMRWGRVSHSAPRWAERVRIHGAAGGTLTCSDTAPIGCYLGGVVAAADAYDHTADCLIAGRAGGNYIPRVETIEPGWVQHLTVEDDFFWAGDTQEFLFAHHNAKMEPPP